MERISTKQAAEMLNINEVGIRVLLQQEKLPIGYAVRLPHSSRYTYYVYRELVQGYIKQVEQGIL